MCQIIKTVYFHNYFFSSTALLLCRFFPLLTAEKFLFCVLSTAFLCIFLSYFFLSSWTIKIPLPSVVNEQSRNRSWAGMVEGGRRAAQSLEFEINIEISLCHVCLHSRLSTNSQLVSVGLAADLPPYHTRRRREIFSTKFSFSIRRARREEDFSSF